MEINNQSPRSANVAVQRPRTIGEIIDEAIEARTRDLHHLMELKAEAKKKGIWDWPQPLVAEFAHPGYSSF